MSTMKYFNIINKCMNNVRHFKADYAAKNN